MFTSVLLYTNKLTVMKRFYSNVLGLDILTASQEQFTVKVGTSELTFVQSEQAAFYHFAINIPGNQFSLMKQWVKEKTPLTRQRAVDQVYYAKFDADAFFFSDPAGNIVELIGRRNRDLFGEITTEAFLNISEVGVVTPFMSEVGDEIQDFGTPLYQRMEIAPEEINLLGRDDSFIVLTPPEVNWNFSDQKATVFPLEFSLVNGKQFVIDTEGKLTVSKA